MRNEYLGHYPDVTEGQIRSINRRHCYNVDAYLHYEDKNIYVRSKKEYYNKVVNK